MQPRSTITCFSAEKRGREKKKKKVVTSSCLRVLSFHIHLVLNDSISAAVFFQGSNVGFCVAERVPKARPPISGGVNKHRYIILRQIYMYIYIYKLRIYMQRYM